MWWEQQSRHSTSSRGVLFCSHHIVTSSVHRLKYTRTEKWNLSVLHNIYRNIPTNQRARKIWWRHLCVCTVIIITHGSSTNQSARNIPIIIYFLFNNQSFSPVVGPSPPQYRAPRSTIEQYKNQYWVRTSEILEWIVLKIGTERERNKQTNKQINPITYRQ